MINTTKKGNGTIPLKTWSSINAKPMDVKKASGTYHGDLNLYYLGASSSNKKNK